jgi:hypothetical protein
LFFKQTGVGLASMAFCSQISVDSIVDAAVPQTGRQSDMGYPWEKIVLYSVFPTRNDNVLSSYDESGIVIYWSEYDRENETHIRLNGSGNVIWQLCDGKRAIYQIIEEVADIYHVPKETCKGPVIRFLTYLFVEGYIVYSPCRLT